MAFFQTASNIPYKEVSLTPATCKHLLADNGEEMISLLHTVVGMAESISLNWRLNMPSEYFRKKWKTGLGREMVNIKLSPCYVFNGAASSQASEFQLNELQNQAIIQWSSIHLGVSPRAISVIIANSIKSLKGSNQKWI